MTFVPLTAEERSSMLDSLGLASTDALFEAIPQHLRFPEIDIGPALTEPEVMVRVEALAAANHSVQGIPFFLGAGAYRHFIPSAIGTILSRSEFGTSYTPYQPEVSQGTLHAMFEFQSLICDLTAMEVTNASVYDGASALAEAALMALRLTGRNRVVISGSVHPRYREVLETYVRPRGVEVHTTGVQVPSSELRVPTQGERPLGTRNPELGTLAEDDIVAAIDERTACCIISQPTFFGDIRDLAAVVESSHAAGALAIEVYNPTSLGLLKPPGDWGVDIAVAEGQPLGLQLSFGGPYLGLLSCRQELVRQLPGRLVGATRDGQGRRGFVLTLQAREQHIRREKATSNICTSQTLMSIGAAAYLALLGPNGLREVAEACWRTTSYAAQQLEGIPGAHVLTPRPLFHEFAVRTPLPAEELNRRLLQRGIIGGYDLGRAYPELADALLLCCTEVTAREQIAQLTGAVSDILAGDREAARV